MNWFKMIQDFYSDGYWTTDMVRDGVKMKKISESEFTLITGEAY
jgi:uncharacterized XkdX family phage protein